MASVLVIGDASVDHIYVVAAIPEPEAEVIAERAVLIPGGAGGTMALGLRLLGGSAALAARVGEDAFGALALRNVEAAGVDLSLVQRDPEAVTGVVTILVQSGGGRTMISHGGANRNLDVAQFRPEQVSGRDALVVSAYSLLGGRQREYSRAVIAAAAGAGVPVFVDLSTGAVDSLGGELFGAIAGVDYLLMNQHEALTLTGSRNLSEAVHGIQERGFANVVVKVGEHGSVIVKGRHSELVDPHQVDDVIDQTGAGDAFTAAFVHAILAGADLREAARLGNIAGAIAATELGAQGRLVSAEELAELAGGRPASKPVPAGKRKRGAPAT
jgi:ribokinase